MSWFNLGSDCVDEEPQHQNTSFTPLTPVANEESKQETTNVIVIEKLCSGVQEFLELTTNDKRFENLKSVQQLVVSHLIPQLKDALFEEIVFNQHFDMGDQRLKDILDNIIRTINVQTIPLEVDVDSELELNSVLENNSIETATLEQKIQCCNETFAQLQIEASIIADDLSKVTQEVERVKNEIRENSKKLQRDEDKKLIIATLKKKIEEMKTELQSKISIEDERVCQLESSKQILKDRQQKVEELDLEAAELRCNTKAISNKANTIEKQLIYFK